MKNIFFITILLIFILGMTVSLLFKYNANLDVIKPPSLQTTETSSYCFTGAFIGDKPSRQDIVTFQRDYVKQPYFVMIFVDWKNFPDLGVIKAILGEGSCPLITWEPWNAEPKTGIDYDGLLQGEYDDYISDFAKLIGSFKSEVCLRFAHEMNGNWYPWSGSKIGVDKYIKIYQYVKDIFDKLGVNNVKWVFSVNWEDTPPIKANDFINYYPGEAYVDYVGIDGYNWGDTQSWSQWITFRELFNAPYNKVVDQLKKPVLISEFSSASSGGDKAKWIQNAMQDIKELKEVKGFVLFNVNKEVDWSFPASEEPGKALKKELEDPYFRSMK